MALGAGTPGALDIHMQQRSEAWTIPLHIVIWTTLLCGLIAVLVVWLL
jgi:hypothetical protein